MVIKMKLKLRHGKNQRTKHSTKQHTKKIGYIVLSKCDRSGYPEINDGPYMDSHCGMGIYHNVPLRAPLRRAERVSDGKRVKQVTNPRQTRQKRRG